MLKLNLSLNGTRSAVELDGQDISRFVRAVTVRSSVGEITTATIEYMGAVVVEGDGRVVLEQAEHLVRCGECETLTGGEVQGTKIFDVTALDAACRVYSIAK